MSVSWKLLAIVAAASVGPLLFGYHLAELNAPQDVLSCQAGITDPYDCIPMSPKDIGLVTSINAVGGCFGSFFAGMVADKYGRRKVLVLNCALFILGPLIMAKATTVSGMSLGRLIAGLASGNAIVIVPVYVNELSPVEVRGLLGAIVQLAITIGILVVQLLGLAWSAPFKWRQILSAGGVIGAAYAVLLLIVCRESPKWLARHGKLQEARSAFAYVRGTDGNFDEELAQWREPEENRSLLGDNTASDSDAGDANHGHVHGPGLWSYVTDAKYRPSLIAVVGVMSIQQLSGINAIIFYGVAILKTSLPTLSGVINCLISVMNVFVTTFMAPMVDKFGRRVLLTFALTGMIITSTTLTAGLYLGSGTLASLSAMLFVVSFGCGLGAIPFLIISELTPPPAVGLAQSIGTTFNWITTFLVGLLFPIFQASLGPSVFLIFTVFGVLSIAFIHRFVPETRGKVSVTQVWRDFK